MNKKKSAMIFLTGFFIFILIGSTVSVVGRTNTVQTVNINETINHINEIMPEYPECYVIWSDIKHVNNTASEIILYNETQHDVLSNIPNITQKQAMQLFSSPQMAEYLYQHCRFFDNHNSPVPARYDEKLGTPYLPKSVQDNVFLAIRKQNQISTNFDAFMKNNSIMSGSAYFFMKPDEVIQKMISDKLFVFKDNCIQAQNATKGVFICKWVGSKFMIDNRTNSVLIFQ